MPGHERLGMAKSFVVFRRRDITPGETGYDGAVRKWKCPFPVGLDCHVITQMARRTLRLPASCATDINFQSRYPGGILIPTIGAFSSFEWLDAGATYVTAPISAATATTPKTIRFMGISLSQGSERVP